MENKELTSLKDIAKQMRRHIITMLGEAGSGHPGGSLSLVEIITSLYFKVMRHNPKEPFWPERDRLILSKGHGAPVLYSALAMSGYIQEESLRTLRKLGSPLQGHPDKRMLPILEASTGSLGMGVSLGIGMALGLRLNKVQSRVYVILGDGECNEGQIWEAAMYAGAHKLDNLTVIVDRNQFQLDASTKDILDMEPIRDKWYAFKWNVIEIDGHDFPSIINALENATNNKNSPTVIIARTVKGKGVSFMEGNNEFHGVAPNKEQVAKALAEIDALPV